MSAFICWPLGLALVFVFVNLQGCGQSGHDQTTTVTTTARTTTAAATTKTASAATTATTTTTATSASQPLPLPNQSCPESMQVHLRELAETWAKRVHLSIALGYAGPDGSGSTCSMGHVAHATTVSHPELEQNFIFGSFTKVWTSSAMLRLQDGGFLNIDEKAFPYMEAAYANATAGRSLVERFGDQIKNVTIRNLLSMRGGIKDYDEIAYQIQHVQEDLDPSRSAQMFGSMLPGQPPGSCGLYSSMSYVLLGLVLIGQKKTSWDSYDQNIWREFFPDIHFSRHGTCSQYVDIREAQCVECKDINVMNMSCTNGFTCGNMVATPRDAARFVWHLFEGQLLSPSSLQEMLTFTPLGRAGATGPFTCSGFCDGCGYGLGVQEKAFGTDFPGHAGQTYGFTTISAYDRHKRGAYVAGIASGNQGANVIWSDLHNLDLLQDRVII